MSLILDVDDSSRIIHVSGEALISDVEEEAKRHGWTLGFHESAATMPVGKWILAGAPGARDKENDPVDQWLAGIEVVLTDGRELQIKPAPRRAVGPDWLTTMIGSRGRLGTVASAHLVARNSCETRAVAYEFASIQNAQAALAWVRAMGARPLSASIVDENTLQLVIEADGPRASAVARVVERVCEERGGSVLEPSTTPDVPRASAASAIIDRLTG